MSDKTKEFRVNNVVIVTQGAYPNGMAPTQRMHHYAKAIAETGSKVTILLPNPPRNIFKNKEKRGNYQGVDFIYTCGTSIRPGSFLKRRFTFTWGQIKLLLYLIKNHKKIDAVIVTTIPYFFNLIIYSLLTRMLGITSIREINEFSFFRKKAKNLPERIYQSINRYLSPKLFKGYLVISENLMEYYLSKGVSIRNLLLVPILVDVDEYKLSGKSAMQNTIVCCGSLSELKDGTLTLIKAFNKLRDIFPSYSLVLTGGNPGSKDYRLAHELVDELKLNHLVKFTGFLSREDLIKLQVEASVLVLAKPESVHADYCFPTKIGEYLSTGNPVVVTNTGEISKHLTNGENAVLVEPGSLDDLTEKLLWVLRNNEDALKIGTAGYQVAKSTFDYKLYGSEITEFIRVFKSSEIAQN